MLDASKRTHSWSLKWLWGSMFNIFRRGKPNRRKSAALLNEIGAALVEQVGQLEAKILLYAEIELSEIDDNYGIDYFVRFARDGSPTVESRPAGDRLATAMQELFAFAKTMDEKHRWTRMEYVVENGEVDIAFSYDPRDADKEDEFWEKGPRLTRKHFGGRQTKSGL